MTRYTDEWLDAKLMNIIAIEPRRQRRLELLVRRGS